MNIQIENAYEHNLKNISVTIPIGKIVGITGVSGSGKSTLLKNVLAAYGARAFTCISTKTVKNELNLSNHIKVSNITNLPQTMFIDVKSSVRNPASTVSTVSGIHETLRNLFTDFSMSECPFCGNIVNIYFDKKTVFTVDLEVNELFIPAKDYLSTHGCILSEEYYDKNGKITTSEKKKALSSLKFCLENPTEKNIKDFNKEYRCRVNIISGHSDIIYDAVREVECTSCHHILPANNRSRMSFNTLYSDGGGACKTCSGTGKIATFDYSKIILDESKSLFDGAVAFVDSKGIKYTTITEKFLIAVYATWNKSIDTPLSKLTSQELQTLFYGSPEKIKFSDRIGGKKEIPFQGIANYLKEAYLNGKGSKNLEPYISETICHDCQGSRIDKLISTFKYHSKTLSELLTMTMGELLEWIDSLNGLSDDEKTYVERLKRKLRNYRSVSCEHLALNRASSTLSGGELQRIRLCSLLNANISGLCYLLDEPSSGLHYQDIEKLGKLFIDICQRGNSIIMVEHNAKLLSYCEYIVDMGPKGGYHGGNVLLQDDCKNLYKYETETAKLLTGRLNYADKHIDIKTTNSQQYMIFSNVTENNLKNISVKIPLNKLTAICGISGSGKTSFVKYVVYKQLSLTPSIYGFDGVDYLGQDRFRSSSSSTVGTLLKINEYVAKIFEKSTGISKNAFMPGKQEGKCLSCSGKGVLLSEAGEELGICDKCSGKGYNNKILNSLWNGHNIYEIYNMPFSELKDNITDKKLKEIAEFGDLLGVGYLSFSRLGKSLSKGEYQRISLINMLVGKTKNRLIILDEPSKGMHYADAQKLVKALQQIIKQGNTMLIVEHNPLLIKNSDYVIEFGGTGTTGGYLLFSGEPHEMSNTPTAEMLNQENITPSYTETDRKPKEDAIIIQNDEERVFLPAHQIHSLSDANGMFMQAAQKTIDDFLSVAIPNNIFFSKAKGADFIEQMPLSRIIDFAERTQLNVSVGMAVGISSLISNIAGNLDCTSDELRYAFDELSPTGKCSNCSGSGYVHSVSIEYFLENGDLSQACKKFLRTSTDFSEFKKLLKKNSNIDLSKKYSDMSELEQNTLFWGIDDYFDIKGKISHWDGIIPIFLRQHKYYPDEAAAKVFKDKQLKVCPVCNGERLKIGYANKLVSGLTYKQWFTLRAEQLAELLQNQQNDFNEIFQIKKCLDLFMKLGLGYLSLSDTISQLNGIELGKLKIISTLQNLIYDTTIVIKNEELLEKKDQSFIRSLVEELTISNTILYLH